MRTMRSLIHYLCRHDRQDRRIERRV